MSRGAELNCKMLEKSSKWHKRGQLLRARWLRPPLTLAAEPGSPGARASGQGQCPQCAWHKGAFLYPKHARPLAPAPLSPPDEAGKPLFALELPSVALLVSQAGAAWSWLSSALRVS